MLSWLTEYVPSRPLGLTRIIVGSAAALRALVALPVLVELTQSDTLRLPYADFMPRPTIGLVVATIGVWIVSAVLFALGRGVAVTGPLLLAAIVFTISLDRQAYSNHLYLMAWLVLLLTVADSDSLGNLYTTSGAGPGEVRITAPDGTRLGVLALPVPSGEPQAQVCATNVAFGDNDSRTLYITACEHVYRIRMQVAGVHPLAESLKQTDR